VVECLVPDLYPSWIEIPVDDLVRASAFYRSVFQLTDTPAYDDPETNARIVVLTPSDKSTGRPGVSLIASPRHHPAANGVQVNFHVGSHALLELAMSNAATFGSRVSVPIVIDDDGTRYVVLSDTEGNSIAISSWEPAEV
jgi:predicted enzyme related to lactoylglutathione lyase